MSFHVSCSNLSGSGRSHSALIPLNTDKSFKAIVKLKAKELEELIALCLHRLKVDAKVELTTLQPLVKMLPSKERANFGELQLDDDGCPICPLCGEKLVESEWPQHIEHEKKKLLGVIQSVKESKLMEPSSNAEQSRRKRELELLRIRNNQQKRLALKRGATPLIRDSLTPFSRQSNDESGSSGSPEVKKEESEYFGGIKCFSCQRSTDYGIVSSSFEQPRCQECFDALRNQAGALPATLTSIMDLRTSVMSPSTSYSPPEKKCRVE
ncbi:unnamed protein product [Nippostrongylus brasiliensis]|uniref:TFIIB-type domain-containing protein n=1 Tax=Nippostrongylus brasiliensis TaxID=27835 RepID=A0A0N4YET0_NIPBR|nr:unnamed protein product [Nippostrongylus brasiliensis]